MQHLTLATIMVINIPADPLTNLVGFLSRIISAIIRMMGEQQGKSQSTSLEGITHRMLRVPTTTTQLTWPGTCGRSPLLLSEPRR